MVTKRKEFLMQLNIIYYLTAALLGGLHALEPGHGKTVVAAYLIGSKGKKIDAVLLGIIVTITHTFSVILLAIGAKVASERFTLSDESLHGYLGFVAGALILVVGLWMLIARIKGKDIFHGHSHDHGHSHHDEPHLPDTPSPSVAHHHQDLQHGHGGTYGFVEEHTHGHDHSHAHPHNPHAQEGYTEKGITYWQLLMLGVSGGLIPCPAAIAVLLAAVAAGRVGEGLTYILLFSLGLASALIAIGLVVIGAGKVASRFLDAKRFARKVSIASAAIITFIGLATVLSSFRHVL
jgi:nickel/cobalt exporter